MDGTVKRIAWVDCAKGAAILLIALHHATSYESALFGNTGTLPVFNWRNVGLLLYHIRLPLFFFVSGMAASGFLAGRPPRLNWRTVRGYALIYVLWSAALFWVIPNWPNIDPGSPISLGQIARLAIGGSVIWYLWAILLCLLAAHATRALPGWLVITAAVGAHALLAPSNDLPGQLPALARSLPFYLIGFRYPDFAARLHDLPRGTITAIVLATLVLAWQHVSLVLLETLTDLVGMGVGLAVARKLPDWLPHGTRPLAWIGQRTLPIYILHFPIIAAIGYPSVLALGPLAPTHPLVWIYAPALAAAAVGCSLALHVLAQKLGGGWLFALGGAPRRRAAAATAP